MKIACPNCDKNLAVGDELAGRRVKCPGCQHVFQIPTSTGVVFDPVAHPMPAATPVPPRAAKEPESFPASDAVQNSALPAKNARRSCPKCGEILRASDTECPECGWASDQIADKPSRSISRRAASADDADGGCYIYIRRDEVELGWAIEKRMKKLIETERLDLRITDEDERPPAELGPDDIVISGKINECDYGSQFIRYWLTLVALIGPGSCKLDVAAEVETAAGGIRRFPARARRWAGFFGGSGPGLMKLNVQVVSNRIARGAARQATGKSFLNAQAYTCANWSLGLGVASLIPFVGVLLGLIGLVVGVVALTTIKRRQLPRGKGAAITGIVLPFIGFAVTAGVILLISQQ